MTAYTWFDPTAESGFEEAGKNRELLERQMTSEEIAKAQELSRERKADSDLAGGATHIVTSNLKDFQGLQPFKISVMTPFEFLRKVDSWATFKSIFQIRFARGSNNSPKRMGFPLTNTWRRSSLSASQSPRQTPTFVAGGREGARSGCSRHSAGHPTSNPSPGTEYQRKESKPSILTPDPLRAEISEGGTRSNDPVADSP